jgi:kinesin family member C2/C3
MNLTVVLQSFPTEAVFAETVPLVRSVMDGFNVCIFAYGQTGSGKTFTMEGVPENRGVNYRTLEELFRMSEERSASVAYTFSVSILEVYNEQINDLLDESSKKYIPVFLIYSEYGKHFADILSHP